MTSLERKFDLSYFLQKAIDIFCIRKFQICLKALYKLLGATYCLHWRTVYFVVKVEHKYERMISLYIFFSFEKLERFWLYFLSNSLERKCLNGEWTGSGNPTCQVMTCPSFSFPNGTYTTTDPPGSFGHFMQDSEANLKCNNFILYQFQNHCISM